MYGVDRYNLFVHGRSDPDLCDTQAISECFRDEVLYNKALYTSTSLSFTLLYVVFSFLVLVVQSIAGKDSSLD